MVKLKFLMFKDVESYLRCFLPDDKDIKLSKLNLNINKLSKLTFKICY